MESNRCSSCSAPFEMRKDSSFARFKVGTLTSQESAKILFPRLHSECFVCRECRKQVAVLARKMSVPPRKTMKYVLSPISKYRYKTKARSPTHMTSASKRPRPSSGTTPREGKKKCGRSLHLESPTRMEGTSTLMSDEDQPGPQSPPSIKKGLTPSSRERTQFRHSNKESAIVNIRYGRYNKTFESLFNLEAGRKGLCDFVKEKLRDEVLHVMRPENKLPSLASALSLEALENFKWQQVMEDVHSKMPMTYTVLQGIMPSLTALKQGTFTRKRHLTEREAEEVWNVKAGNIVANVLYAHRPKIYKFWQAVVGVEMWRQGATGRLYNLLHHVGVCQTVNASRDNVDKICSSHDRDILEWKESVAKQALSTSETSTDDGCSYSLCWDNIKWKSGKKHQTGTEQTQFYLRALCYGIKHRTPSLQLPNDDVVLPQDIHPTSVLPGEHDVKKFKERMAVVVQRILVQHISALRDVCVENHVPHQFTTEMSRKSSIVNLGLIDEDPSSHPGVQNIMRLLQNKYCPEQEDKLFTLPCSGDRLSVERMRFQREILCSEGSPRDRLEGLLPTPQEFHKEALLLQDTMNELFHIGSINSKGTLYQLKEFFQHKFASSKVIENFYPVWDLIKFATHAYVVLLMMKLTQMDGLEETPKGFPENGSKRDKRQWLIKLSDRIVSNVWVRVPREEMEKIVTGAMGDFSNDDDGDDGNDSTYSFCSCREEKQGEKMIHCCNSTCSNGWYHISCLDDRPPTDTDEDWYCSKKCKSSENYTYCICQRHRGKEDLLMVQCELAEACTKHEWYHPSCVGIQADTLPDDADVWFCSEECQLGERGDDQVLEYSKRLTLEGLRHLTRRDFIREGDGEGLVSCWKLDFVDFWNRNHTDYKLITHLFLSNIAGAAPSRLKHELIWERLGNVSGRQGKNMPLDQINEHLVRDCKDMLKRSHGLYTDRRLARCSQLSGAFGRHIDNLLSDGILGEDSFCHSGSPDDSISKYASDVATFVEVYSTCDLWTYKGKRQHDGLHRIEPGHHVKNPLKFGKYIAKRNRVTTWMSSQEVKRRMTHTLQEN